MTNPNFHFMLLAVGAVLNNSNTVTSLKIQDLIVKDGLFPVEIRLPLDDCSLALTLMEQFGFIQKTAVAGEYERVVSTPVLA